MQLSIIIPVYNVEANIEKCVKSLQQQDICKEDYEIIIVNDGSPDNSREVVLKLMEQFNNIVFIEHENKGVSVARNNALAIAKGTYILPIDPDDYILPNTLKGVLNRIVNKNLDVLYLGFEIFDAYGNSAWHTDYTKQTNQVFNGVEGYFAGRGKAVRDSDRSWAILYRKVLLDQYEVSYPKNVPYLEDGVFLAKVFAVAQKVGFDNQAFYQRTTRAGSATNSNLFYYERAVNGFLIAIENLNQFEEAQKLTVDGVLLLNHVKAKFLILPLSSCIASRNKKEYKKLICRLKEMGYQKIKVDGLRLGYKTIAMVYNFSHFLFYYFFPFNQKLKQLLQ
jgi:glycosyltransferase involved in cell wall biosynthesis